MGEGCEASYRHLEGFNSECIQNLKYQAHRRLDIVVRGEAAEAKSDGSLALNFGEAHGAKHMGGFRDAGCTGGTGSCGQPRLQRPKDVLRVEAIESDVGVAGMAAIVNW